ncbi:TetR/AcrR family transcriptional regulator [Castellaniella daejeonensis]|jgi:AcrR family transcriptional regulator|uniref:TetR/AcrR family transcriptional regulator n=1 Tax=Castellaniella daejeonensis TaxID=659013 RepID=A0ABP3DJL1_9BURK|nr:TetR/AcrR family transcriptional regulator [Castellaniella sp.]HET8704105.1 TetR/AcrR family transcriptional regulator [Castellaniella sp.]
MTQKPNTRQAPISRDTDRSQAAILRAARDEFTEHGFAGGRVDRIAVRAGVNKRLIYYYFGNKDELFLSVLEHTYADIRQAEQSLHLDALEPVEALRTLVSFTWHYFLDHPEFLSLLASENLSRASHLKQSGKIREMHSPLVQLLDRLLERGQAQGLFRSGIDPVQLYISIASLGFFYLANNYTLSVIFGRDLRAADALEERLAHMTDLVVGYASSRPDTL